MSINKKRRTSLKVTAANKKVVRSFEGGNVFKLSNPLIRLQCMAASSFFGEPSFYVDGAERGPTEQSNYTGFGVRKHITLADLKDIYKTLKGVVPMDWGNKSTKEVLEKCIDDALEYNPEATLNLAIELRKVDNIRSTPQVIMVRAANHKDLKGTGLVRKYNEHVIMRGDEPGVQLAYQLSEYGKPIPNSLKRSWADFLKKSKEYSLAKYRMKNRVVKTVDVGNMALGKGFYGYDTPIGDLMRGDLKLGGDNSTWQSIISGGGTWKEAIKVMGHMALLRNIRNFLEHGIKPALFLDKLMETAKEGKQLPFRYFTAYKYLSDAPGAVLDALETCLDISIENIPILHGRNLILTDVSGSMKQGTVSSLNSTTLRDVGNLMGVLTGMRSEEGIVAPFANDIAYYNVRKRASVFDQMRAVNERGTGIGRGTNNPLVLALIPAIRAKDHFDNIFVYSDMQVKAGGLMAYGDTTNTPRLIEEYRRHVNPNVFIFLIQMGGYDTSLLPEFYDKTFALSGWSSRTIDFANRMHELVE